MAKRYHNSKKAGSGFELGQDNSAVAMMPQEVIYRSVSEPYGSLNYDYPDTPAGVDAQISADMSQMRKGFKPTKV